MTQSPFKINTTIPVWYIIVAIVGMAVMWGSLSSQTKTNTDTIKNIQDGQATISNTLTDLRVSQGRLEASVGNAASDLNFIKQRLK